MIYKADYLLPISSQPVKDGQMLVDSGAIVAVGQNLAARYPDEELLEFPGCAILPGFVNSHTHIELTGLKGQMDGMQFFEWLSALGAEGRNRPIEFFEEGSQSACREMLAGGTTTIGDISSHGISHRAIEDSGIRAVVFSEIIAFGSDDEALESVRNVFTSLPDDSPLISHSVSIHTLFTASPKTIKLAVELAEKRGLRLAIHAAESLAEIEFMSGRGAIADYHKSKGLNWRLPEVSPIEYLRDMGVLSSNTVAIHCTQASSKDLDILAAVGAGVAHCPTSNARLGHGIATVRDMIKRGISVGLGTDSAVSCERLDMFQEMRSAVLFSRAREKDPAAILAAEALKMATLGGAEVLGLEETVGSLEPGKKADFIAVDLSDSKSTTVDFEIDPVQHLVFLCGPEHVRAVWVDGVEMTSLNRQGANVKRPKK